MHTGAITSYIDVAQIALYAFWIFFAGLIYYLRREDKREGYPLESDRSGHVRVQGWPRMPKPKTFLLRDGAIRVAPRAPSPAAAINATPVGAWLGAPLEPTGNPMLDGVGPAAYANRPEEPDRTVDGALKIVPLRVAKDFSVEARDPDPRGMAVIGADGAVGGVVVDAWVDRSEAILRYLEVEVPAATGGRRVLLPVNFTRINGGRRRVKVKSILGSQFATVPGLHNPDQVTLREEDRITAYYAGGTLYASASRMGPVL
jgi:photosynthetic reaction center H subunit